MKFLILDVFAETRHAGNQLAVIFDAGGLPTESMQAIAREFNFSESTFLLSDRAHEGAWDVRIFTPNEEIPFGGHPTLGTSWAIAHELIDEPVDRLTLNLKAGRIPVDFTYRDDGTADLLWMRQLPPTFGEIVDRDVIARLLRLDPSQVDGRFPSQEVSTGLPFLIAPLRDLGAVRQARLDVQEYEQLIGRLEAKAVFLFGPGSYDPANDLNARLFADFYGVPEDPATGSATGCLAGYLARYRYFGGPEAQARVEQGTEIRRPSLLLLQSKDLGDEIEVRVGGRVQLSARGKLV